MKLRQLELAGLFLARLEPMADERGHMLRTWCEREAQAAGLNTEIKQCSVSYTQTKGTIRGLHYQNPPAAEEKWVRVVRGAIFDVVIDLREQSPTFLKFVSMELHADRPAALYIPKGMAHGFQTLAPDTEVAYQISAFHSPQHAAGIRYDDPSFAIPWPLPVSVISENDRT